MPHPTVVILIVALNRQLIDERHAPNLARFAASAATRTLRPDLPAVTCTVQSSMLTGVPPREHGIVGNGWYDRDLAEVQFWKQSNRLVQAEKVWETARRRDPTVTTLNMFWWYNMYSSADWSVTPRPMYKADGRKIPDCYSNPPELRDELQNRFGQFPLFNFWGPASSIESSRWIADATMHLHARLSPTLTLVYLPHLDYALQKLGPEHRDVPRHVREIDEQFGRLLEHFESRGVRVVVVSEYGIEQVNEPIHPNRVLRRAGLVRIREEQRLELLDAGASEAFAVADHQIAHIYVQKPDELEVVRQLFEAEPGVERVLDREAQRELNIDHPRAGDLILIAKPGRWFTYYHWLDDARAPDFARTVDIHRKPGYDPVELFIDPAIRFPRAAIARKLARRAMGFRTLLDVIPLDATLVRGSHGRVDLPPHLRPVIITRDPAATRDRPDELHCTDVRDVILEHLFEPA